MVHVDPDPHRGSGGHFGGIRIGTLVASPNFRHPLTLAKDLIALDDISDGRVICGVGAGGGGWDATVLGGEPWTLKERTARFAEFVELLDLLLLEREVTWKGSYYAVDEARTYPGCVQKPRLPLAVAAGAPRALAVAARYADIWVTIGGYGDKSLEGREGAQLVANQIELLSEESAKVGTRRVGDPTDGPYRSRARPRSRIVSDVRRHPRPLRGSRGLRFRRTLATRL